MSTRPTRTPTRSSAPAPPDPGSRRSLLEVGACAGPRCTQPGDPDGRCSEVPRGADLDGRCRGMSTRAGARDSTGAPGQIAWAPCPSSSTPCRKARKAHGDKVILDDVTHVVLPRREDRRRRPERRRQVDDPEDHGRPRPALQRRGAAHARATPSASCMQEPPLDEDKTVLGNVEEGVGEIKAQARPLQRDRRRDGRAGRRLRRAARPRWASCRRRIDAADAWDLDSQLEQAMDALRCPPPDADVTVLSGGERRRVALCKLLLQKPDLLLLDEPTNHLDAESVLWLEQHLAEYPGAVLAVTHDRYFLDNVAEWILEVDRGRAYPYEGNYSTYLEKKADAPRGPGQEGRQAAPSGSRTSSSGCAPTPRAARPSRKARLARYEEMAAEAERTRKLDFEEIQIPPGPRLGNDGHRGQEPRQGLRRPRAHRRPVASRCRATASSASSARTASARPRCSRRSSASSSPTAASSRSARRSRSPTSTRAAAASTRRRRCGRSSPTASTTSRSATSRCPSRAYVVAVRLQGPGPAEAGRRALRR